ncbi:MAG: hypothetical protein U0586_17245, partial [Candidatus Brocadiaceae bacterium]
RKGGLNNAFMEGKNKPQRHRGHREKNIKLMSGISNKSSSPLISLTEGNNHLSPAGGGEGEWHTVVKICI